MAKCRIDSFRLRGTGSMCHMFLLNVDFSNACRFRVFQCHFSTDSQLPQCWHGRTEYWKLPAFLPNIHNVVTNFSCWQCLCTFVGPISLLYKQLLQYTWRRGSVVRMSVCSCRTFPVLHLIHGWRVTTFWVRRPLWINQLGQLSLPSLRGR